MALIGDESPPSKPSKPVSQWIGSARWRFVRKVLVIAPALCVTILLLLSLLPQMPGLRGLDDSYLVCINFAIMHRIRLGIDFFSTYGPWGFLYDGFYYPGLYGKKLACDFLLAIALFMGIYRICRNARMSPVAASWWVVLVVLWLTPAFGDARIISMCLLPLLLRRTNNQKQDSMESFLLVFVLALAGNCKFTYLNIGIAVIGLLAVEDILSKRVPKMLLLYVGSFLFWRALSGQTIADFPAYYAGSSAIAKGYMGAMSLDGDHAVTTGVVWLFSILVSLQMLHCFWHTSIVSRFITVASFAGVFFILNKQGFDRNDGVHEIVATMGLLTIVLICTPLLWRQCITRASVLLVRVARVVVALNIMFSAWSVESTFDRFFSDVSFAYEIVQRSMLVGHRAVAAIELMKNGVGLLNDKYAKAMQAIRASCPLPALQGTTDMYGSQQIALLAADLNYRPRPCFMGFQAFSPFLIEANRRSIMAASSPDNLIFQPEGIDARVLSMEEGALWPEIIARYAPVGATPTGYLVLHKRERPRSYQFTLLANLKCRADSYFNVPAVRAGVVWIEIHARQTVAGKLEEAILRSPKIEIKMKVASGGGLRNDIIPGMTETGFVLSPVVRDWIGFLKMMTGENKQIISQVSIIPQDGSIFGQCFEPEFDVTFKQLTFSNVALRDIPAFASIDNLRDMASTADKPKSVSTYIGDGGKLNLLTLAPTQLYLKVPENMKNLHVAGGFQFATSQTDPVRYLVFAVNKDESKSQIFRLEREPMNTAYWREFKAEVPLPPGTIRLNFETQAIGNRAYPPCYWTDIRFE